MVNAFPERVKKKTCMRCITQSNTQLTATVLLTGLGKREITTATAEALAQGEAAALILIGHSQAETQPHIDEINQKYPKAKVIFVTADFGSLTSVREAAETIKKLDVPIDGIVGYPTVLASEWEKTADGVESHFQRNYLSHFLLVNLLLGKMPEGARVVMISSSIRPDAPAMKFDNPNFSVSICTIKSGKLGTWTDGLESRTGKHITRWTDMRSRCSPISSSRRGWQRRMLAGPWVRFLSIQVVSCIAIETQAIIYLRLADIKLNIQSYASPELVASWLQKKKKGGQLRGSSQMV